MDVKELVKPNVYLLRAYQAKEIPCSVKLDANESPYGVESQVSVRTNRYPDSEARELRSLVARRWKVKSGNILHGNGSDELIYYLITAFGGPVLYPVPTFSMYGIISQALGEETIEIPLDSNFDLDREMILDAIGRQKPKLIFLSSPNNPTGNRFSSEKVLEILRLSPGLVVVDEAYQPFLGKNEFVPLIREFHNLVVLRTLSKIGLAALRVGFMIGNPDVISQVNKVRLPFNLNALSQRIAVNALNDMKHMHQAIRVVVSERKRMYREMGKMSGVEPYPSEANFILFRVGDAEAVFEKIMERGILVKNMNDVFSGCLRVTVGTPKENNVFLDVLRQVCIEGSSANCV